MVVAGGKVLFKEVVVDGKERGAVEVLEVATERLAGVVGLADVVTSGAVLVGPEALTVVVERLEPVDLGEEVLQGTSELDGLGML